MWEGTKKTENRFWFITITSRAWSSEIKTEKIKFNWLSIDILMTSLVVNWNFHSCFFFFSSHSISAKRWFLSEMSILFRVRSTTALFSLLAPENTRWKTMKSCQTCYFWHVHNNRWLCRLWKKKSNSFRFEVNSKSDRLVRCTCVLCAINAYQTDGKFKCN